MIFSTLPGRSEILFVYPLVEVKSGREDADDEDLSDKKVSST